MTPHRIAIVGPGGSGKTTLAIKLAKRFDLPITHLDWHIFVGRHLVAESEQRRRVANLLTGGAWIVEGAAWRVLDLLFAEATIIVVTDPPFRRSVSRLVRRELRETWRGWTLRTLKEYLKLPNPLFWACYYPLVERRRVLRSARAAQPGAHLIIAKTAADAERRIELALKQ